MPPVNPPQLLPSTNTLPKPNALQDGPRPPGSLCQSLWAPPSGLTELVTLLQFIMLHVLTLTTSLTSVLAYIQLRGLLVLQAFPEHPHSHWF